MKYTVRSLLFYIGYSLLITVLWQWYEVANFGEVRPDAFDSIVGVVLAISLTVNTVIYLQRG